MEFTKLTLWYVKAYQDSIYLPKLLWVHDNRYRIWYRVFDLIAIIQRFSFGKLVPDWLMTPVTRALLWNMFGGEDNLQLVSEFRRHRNKLAIQ